MHNYWQMSLLHDLAHFHKKTLLMHEVHKPRVVVAGKLRSCDDTSLVCPFEFERNHLVDNLAGK